jgi:branched-chain amino acid transport system permease protein
LNYLADIGVNITIIAILAVSLNLLIGFAGQFSQSHAVFYGIGAYTTGLTMLKAGFSLPLSIVTSVLLAFVFAWFIAVPAVKRVQGEFIILLTIAFQMVVNQLMASLTDFTGGAYGLSGIPPLVLGGIPSYPPYVFLLFVLFAVIVVLICRRVGDSPFGRLLKGIREDEEAVRSLGKRTVGKKLIVFGFSAAIAGYIGGFAAMYYQFIAPTQFTLDYSIFIIAAIVLGGLGNIKGSVIGAIILGSIQPILNNVPGIGQDAFAWQQAIYGILLVVLMFVRPQGIFPEVFKPNKSIRDIMQESGDEIARQAFLDTVDTKSGGKPHVDNDNCEIVEVNDISKSFGGIHAVSNVSFKLQRNRITALIGPNGAGKTTIFRLIVGTHKPDTGTVKLYGENITNKEPEVVAQKGMVRSFQDVRLFKQLSVLENIAMAVPRQRGESMMALFFNPKKSNFVENDTQIKALSYLKIVGMHEKAFELVSNLSYGETKLVAIARLLATECEVMLLDEPTSGVDPNSVDEMLDVVKRLKDAGKTICIIEHSLHVVEKLADHVIFLESGTVITEGPLAEIKANNELVQSYFGT